MFCVECGNKLEDGARFCTSCGAAQPVYDAVPSDAPAYDAQPVYDAPQPVYDAQPPVYDAPPPYPPVDNAPVYDAPPAYPPVDNAPVYEAPPVYDAPPAYPPVDNVPVYDAPPPVYDAPPPYPPIDNAPPVYPPVDSIPVYDEQPQAVYMPVYDAQQPQQPYVPPQAPPQQPPYAAPYQNMQQQKADTDKKKMKVWMPIAAAVVVVILVIGALWLFTDVLPWTHKNESSSDAASTEDETTDVVTEATPEDVPEDIVVAVPDETPSSEPPTPDTPPPPVVVVLAGNGEVVIVENESEFSFTPDVSGRWEISTSENDGDPMLTLYDVRGNIIMEDDDMDYSLNARIFAVLEAGVTYTIRVGFYEEEASCKLSVLFSAPIDVIPPEGGTVRVFGDSIFSFTPTESGIWEFITSDSDGFDPILTIADSSGDAVAAGDDTDYDLNAYVSVFMYAGSTYYIDARFYDEQGEYDLTASFGEGSAVRPGTMSGVPISSEGGVYSIEDTVILEFVPFIDGLWIFETSDSGEFDPYLTIYDKYGEEMQYDDDSAGDYNAIIYTFLKADEEYYIEIKFYSADDPVCLLSVYLPELLPAEGGVTNVNADTAYTFIPAYTAEWEFATSNSGDSDPYIVIMSTAGEYITFSDNEAGGFDAWTIVELNENEIYFVLVGFDVEDGMCELSVIAQ
ncbi:MAG: zinc-ribbon domain-containing protein [Oscillospiraceae bacterium]|nr:zinc-ribbon domain-containing protein [Oscillospiraceae bacterium]